MLTILLHSSKTMRTSLPTTASYQAPTLLAEAKELMSYLQTLSVDQVAVAMQLSNKVAVRTHATIQAWSIDTAKQVPAIDAFLGDIYSGLQAQSLSKADRAYANNHLFLLSGLYGILRALDSIAPYRLEMDYRFPAAPYSNLYTFWGKKLAQVVPADSTVINLSSVEYSKAIVPYVANTSIITPKFMTRNASGKPVFVAIHAKVARGAFARWLIQQRITKLADLASFKDLNYRYDAALSTADRPIFVCDSFGGLGLSIRLT